MQCPRPPVLRSAQGRATGERVSCLMCPGQDDVWAKEFPARGLHSLCASLAGGPGVSRLSTTRLRALGSPREDHTQEPSSLPPWPLCPGVGSGSSPGGLLGGQQISREHVYLPRVLLWLILTRLPNSAVPFPCPSMSSLTWFSIPRPTAQGSLHRQTLVFPWTQASTSPWAYPPKPHQPQTA